MTALGTKVQPEDDTVAVEGNTVSLPTEYKYFLLHKPPNVISTVDDPHNRKTVVDLIDTPRRIYPVGRLDYETTGVLLLTDDGELTQQLTHPSNEVGRTYEIFYSGVLPDDAVEMCKSGLDIGEDQPAFGRLNPLWGKDQSGAAHLTLYTGRYHEVKRIFEVLGCHVERLHRLKFAGLDCGGLAPGEYRELTNQEIQTLKSRG